MGWDLRLRGGGGGWNPRFAMRLQRMGHPADGRVIEAGGEVIEAEGCGVGREEGEDLGDGLGEAFPGCGLAGGLEEAGGEVAVVGGVARGEDFGLLVEFEELVGGDAAIEPSEAGEGGGGGATGNDDAEALVEAGLAGGGGG